MAKVKFGVPFGGSKNWNDCIVKPEQNCTSPKPSSWSESEIKTVVTANFKNNNDPEVMNYLTRRVFPGPIMNAMLADMESRRVRSSVTAADFLARQGDVWKSWVSTATAAKISKSIQ